MMVTVSEHAATRSIEKISRLSPFTKGVEKVLVHEFKYAFKVCYHKGEGRHSCM